MAAVLGLLAAGAHAQEQPEELGSRKKDLTIFTTFGWSGVMPAERWGPVTVELGALVDPLSGYVVIEYPQDDTQWGRVSVPFASTPGRATRVQAVVALPANPARITVSVVDDRGRTVRSLMYGRSWSLQLPPSVRVETQPLLVTVGRISAGDAVAQWGKALAEVNIHDARMRGPQGPASPPEQIWFDPAIGRCELADLPLSPIAYDAVHLLAVNADVLADADPRAVEAIQHWVRGGGRLALVAMAPGDAWRRWFDEASPAPVEVQPVQAAGVPEVVSSRIAEFDQTLRTGAAEQPDLGIVHEALPGPAEFVPQRAIRLTDAGAAAGWSLRWKHDGGGETGLLAEGPVGLGWVMVLGVEPARVTATSSNRAAGALWIDALQTVSKHHSVSLSYGNQNMWYGYSTPVYSSISAAIERVGRVPLIGDSVFLVIVLAMLVLAGMIGPVDYFLLKKLEASQRSWATALAWTALASLGAYVLPPVIRTEPTQMYRVSVVDAIARPAGPAGAAEVQSAWSTAVTGIYTAQSGTVQFENVDPASWWRGMSASPSWREDTGSAGAVVPIVQTAVGGEAGSMRGGPLLSMPISLWTFRTLMDYAQPKVPLSVLLKRRGEQWESVVAGMPAGARVTHAVLRVGQNWILLDGTVEQPAPTTSSHTPFIRPRERSMEAPAYDAADPVGQHEQGAWTGIFSRAWKNQPYSWSRTEFNEYMPYAVDTSSNPGPLMSLPGSISRAATMEHLLATGRYAVLYLAIDNWPAEPTLSWSAEYRHSRVLRLVVPLGEKQAEEEENREEGSGG